MFSPLVRCGEPHEPSLFWSLSRKATPRPMAPSMAPRSGGGTGLGRGMGSAPAFGLSGLASDFGLGSALGAAETFSLGPVDPRSHHKAGLHPGLSVQPPPVR